MTSRQANSTLRPKPLFDEPRGNAALKKCLSDYDAALNGPLRGALLAAVCRGKLCEGIDFTDRQCRMVLLFGIPYPNRTELRVTLKQAFAFINVQSSWCLQLGQNFELVEQIEAFVLILKALG